MAARSTWAGAITFAGFPIHVKVFTVVGSRKNASFKMLDPVHKQPVHQKLVDCEGVTVERAATLKGVEASKGVFVAIEGEALEMIENVGRSVVVEVERFAPVQSIALDLSLESYTIVPDDSVAGSEQPVAILWNGLREGQRAAIIPDWCPRAGARPSTLAIHATAEGLTGNLIPFGSELKADLPSWVPVADEKAAALASAVIERDYNTDDFDLSAYTDGYAERRQAAITLALSGEKIEVSKPAEAAPAVPNLMAALEASLAAAPAKPKAKAAKEKVAA